MLFKFTNPRHLPLFVTQGFGENSIPLYKELGMKGHNGWDCFANDGDEILATHDGVVTFAGDDGSAGLGVVIRTTEQFEDVNGRLSYWKSLYWHLQRGSIIVHADQAVKKGQVIARADNTGLSTGTHLHFGIKPVEQGEQDWQWGNLEVKNGYNGAVDPKPYYQYRFDKDLKLGDVGSEVMNLQERLKVEGFFPGKIVDTYGPITRKAVYDYQISKNIAPLTRALWKGKYCGPATRAILNL